MTLAIPRYPQSAITAKRGVNHVRITVENAGSLFLKIEEENDLGIDALIEFIQNGTPLNHQIAVQIKSGQSYYDSDSKECLFPIGNHREYWSKHRLPVYGIVYVPSLDTAHWVDIKHYLKSHPQASTVRFPTSEANRFDESSFIRIILSGVARQVPTLSLGEAIGLARSSNLDEIYLGVVVLFRRYPNVLQVWDELLRCFRDQPRDQIPDHLIYFLAHVPGHGDIFYHGEQLNPATQRYATQLLAGLSYADVIKLLSFIDPESSISRGSLGQSVEAIISSLPTVGLLLRQSVADGGLDMFMRECAAMILAMNERMEAVSVLSELAAAGSWYANEMLAHLKERGQINPYA